MSKRAVPLICPNCGGRTRVIQTQYGRRDNCDPCGLHSWNGKPLVSREVHASRQEFHAAFDPLWRNAPSIYPIHEAPETTAHAKAVKRIRRAARNRTYRWLAAQTGLPEPECHGAEQTDLQTLRLLTETARRCRGPMEIREWSKTHEETGDE